MARCNSRQFTEWQAEYELDPWGDERADLRCGIIACTIANVNRGKGQRSLKPGDFMPEFDKPIKERQTQAEMIAVMAQFAAKHNAALARRRA